MRKILTVPSLSAPSSYRDSRSRNTTFTHTHATTCTLYLGNLSFFTTEEQIHALFSRCASAAGIRRIVMGLDRNEKTPCGFAFVEYYTHADAENAMLYVSGTKLDERIIRCDLDAQGYVDGRQFGRGKSGGQVRDEHRTEFDSGRGGWGRREAEVRETYAGRDEIPVGGAQEWERRAGEVDPVSIRGKRARNDDDDADDDEEERGRRINRNE